MATDQVSAPPAARTSRRPWTFVIVAVIVVVVLLLAAGGYLLNAFATGGSDVSSADKAIESARVDNNQIYDSLKGPSLPSTLNSSQDAQQARQTLNSYSTTFKSASTKLDSDLAKLSSVDSRLKSDSDSVLLLPMKNQLQERKRRVEYLMTAFKSAKTLLGIVETQVPTYLALVDVVDQFNALLPLIDNNNWSGALGAYPKLEQALQTLVASANSKNIPPQIATMAKLMNTMTTDLKGLIQSLQSNDVSAIEASASKVGADADALQALDTSQIDSFETNLLKPYVDSYDANMKKAGFTIQS